MVILHVATIKNNPFNGVCVVVPQHVTAQSQYAEVALLNIENENIGGVECKQFAYKEGFSIDDLEVPYNNPDIVVFHEGYSMQMLAISKQLKKRGIPYVLVPHGCLTKEAQKKKWLKKKVANFLLFNRFINGAVAIQCLSEKEREGTRFGKNRFIGTNGINIPSEQKSEFSKEGLKVTYIGRLDAYHKGLDILIESVAKIGDTLRKQGVKVYLYGPDYRGRFAHVEGLISENSVGDIISLNREVSGDEKKEILLSSDVFVQSSRFEGMPMGILEALGMGIPVLITEGTTLGELVREYDAGYVAKTEVDDLAKTFLQAIRDKGELRDKSKNASRLALENFSWETVSKKTVEDYKNLCQ